MPDNVRFRRFAVAAVVLLAACGSGTEPDCARHTDVAGQDNTSLDKR